MLIFDFILSNLDNKKILHKDGLYELFEFGIGTQTARAIKRIIKLRKIFRGVVPMLPGLKLNQKANVNRVDI